MPLPPSIRKSIAAVRAFIASGGGEGTRDLSPYRLCHDLFQKPDQILDDSDTLDAVLALAPEIEAYRGKGSQIMQKNFNRDLGGLLYRAKLETTDHLSSTDLFSPGNEPQDSSGSPPYWAERLSDYFFERVGGKPVRSSLAGSMRYDAWLTLGELSHFYRRPEHLTLALDTAAEKQRSDEERVGAIQFLLDYWADEDPDKATIDLLENLRGNPPNRSFLVSVLQTQIELGLNDEMKALSDVDGWDDAAEEGEGDGGSGS